MEVQRRESELGELLSAASKSQVAEDEAVRVLQSLQGDDTNAALFDLVPIWKVNVGCLLSHLNQIYPTGCGSRQCEKCSHGRKLYYFDEFVGGEGCLQKMGTSRSTDSATNFSTNSEYFKLHKHHRDRGRKSCTFRQCECDGYSIVLSARNHVNARYHLHGRCIVVPI